MEKEMFCFQCQETARGQGCTLQGVCGKGSDLSGKMDLLLFVVRGVAVVADKLRNNGAKVGTRVNHFITDALFATITNANFCQESIKLRIGRGLEIREKLKLEAKHAGIRLPDIPEVEWHGNAPDEDNMRAPEIGVLREKDEDIRSLKELVMYGLKGIAAYHEHAMRLGYNSCQLHAFTQNALSRITIEDLSIDEFYGLVMETGEQGIKVMELLDKANTETFGNPEITVVSTGVRKRPGILISGHDLHDLEQLLEQTTGTGVDVYTHSEMLPGHYYPAFRRYRHFAGNYGGAWWNQRDDFTSFNGPIIFTSNCIVPPLEGASYSERIFTSNSSAYPGCRYIKEDSFGKKDYSEVIDMALQCAPPDPIESGRIIGGFAHNQVMMLADKIVEAVQSGAIRKFVVMAGCDGRMKSRTYYTEFARMLPQDCVILTAGCAKYRYIKMDLGEINGIPRVLDAGQCNDCYSLIRIAVALKEILGANDINDLPIVYNIAWYEQKAVLVLLALLALGIKDIHIGPTMPAFLSANIYAKLIHKFGIKKISTPQEDLKAFGLLG